MHVPFSMSDEPDLGDEFRSHLIDHHEGDYLWEEKSETLVRMYTQAEVDDAIAKIIRQHMKTIDEYRNEIVELQDKVESLHEYINDIAYEQSMRDFYEAEN